MTNHYNNYDESYWQAAGMDEDPRPAMVVAVVAFASLALVGLGLVALVIYWMIR